MASDHTSKDSIAFFRKLDTLPKQKDAEPVGDTPSVPSLAPRAQQSRRWVFTASLVGAVLFGAFANGIATYEIVRRATPVHPYAALTGETEKLKLQVVQLVSEFADFKVAAKSADHAIAQQLASFGEHQEKTQQEAVGQMTRISESIDRLEHRVLAAPDMTGAVTTIEKQSDKPPEVEGWKLRNYDAGRAMVQSRSGQLFYVRPGTNIPGVGKIETIKRVDGKVIITTPKGVITSSLESRAIPARIISSADGR